MGKQRKVSQRTQDEKRKTRKSRNMKDHSLPHKEAKECNDDNDEGSYRSSNSESQDFSFQVVKELRGDADKKESESNKTGRRRCNNKIRFHAERPREGNLRSETISPGGESK